MSFEIPEFPLIFNLLRIFPNIYTTIIKFLTQQLPKFFIGLIVLLLTGVGLQAQTYVNFTINQPTAPSSSFTYSNTNLTYDSTDASTPTPTAWAWDFGDGATDNTQNPTHTYAQEGQYVVCLTITDGDNCTATTCDSIMSVGFEMPGPVQGLSIFPNPFTHETQVSYTLETAATVTLEVTNLMGQSLWLERQDLTAGTHETRLGADLADGVYLLSVEVDGRRLVRRIIRNQ